MGASSVSRRTVGVRRPKRADRASQTCGVRNVGALAVRVSCVTPPKDVAQGHVHAPGVVGGLGERRSAGGTPQVFSPMLVLTSTPAEQLPNVHLVVASPGVLLHSGVTGPQIWFMSVLGGRLKEKWTPFSRKPSVRWQGVTPLLNGCAIVVKFGPPPDGITPGPLGAVSSWAVIVDSDLPV